MSTKFETPANNEQSHHSDRDEVVNLMLFSCAFDKPPASSSNDSLPSGGPGNLLKISDWSRTQPSDTAGSAVGKVLSSLGDNLHNPSSDGTTISGSLGSILPGLQIDWLPPSRPHSRPHENGSGTDNTSPLPATRPQSRPPENGSGTDNTSPLPPTRPQSRPPENGSGTDNTSPLPPSRPQTRPNETGSGTDISEIKFPKFDRTSKFKFPENTPLDAKHADEMTDRVSKWIKESVDKDGNLKLDLNTLDRLKEVLQYGVSHGEKGLQEIVAKLNKKLEGTGIEIKTDGKAFAHYQTCMPQIQRGDHMGDFIGFDVMKNGKKVDSNLVKVGSGDLDRMWNR